MFFDGPVDTTVPDVITDDLLATMGEALTNVARHANAARVDVSLTVGDDVVLTVVDDGIAAARPTGATHPDGGTILTWRTPTRPPHTVQ